MIVKVENEVYLAEMKRFFGEDPVPPTAKREVEMCGNEWNLIADAIEKQIPKKVIVNKDGCRNCPNCDANESWICYEQDVNETFNYCACCGQKLDWENNNGSF